MSKSFIAEECKNTLQERFPDDRCSEWKHLGCCERFPGSNEKCPKMGFPLNSKFMKTHCAMTCGLCSSSMKYFFQIY